MSGFERRKASSSVSEMSQELCKKLTQCQVFIEEGEFERERDEPYIRYLPIPPLCLTIKYNRFVVVAESVYVHV